VTARDAQVGFLLDALRAGDASTAESAALLLLSGGMSLIELYDDVLMPFFASVRDDYEDGRLRLVDEHMASQAATELVVLLGRRQYPWAHNGDGAAVRGLVVLGAVPREQHVLGNRMLAQVLQCRGWSVHVLDALPYESHAAYCAALERPPDVFGLSLHTVPPPGTLRSGIATLRAELPDLPVVLGGAAMRAAPGLPVKVGASGGAATLQAGVAAIEAATNPLTRRERQILGLVAGGASNAQIASELSVHSSTVKTHLEHVAGKLGTSDRTAAAVQGLRRGWID
jgi:DNA-binding CsgD family transcriptional regulator